MARSLEAAAGQLRPATASSAPGDGDAMEVDPPSEGQLPPGSRPDLVAEIEDLLLACVGSPVVSTRAEAGTCCQLHDMAALHCTPKPLPLLRDAWHGLHMFDRR